jgi:hypothetical protein
MNTQLTGGNPRWPKPEMLIEGVLCHLAAMLLFDGLSALFMAACRIVQELF